MTMFTRSLFRRESKKNHIQVSRRRLALEPLEGRRLLTIVTLTPVKDNTLFNDTTTELGSTSNGAGNIFVGLNNDANRIKRGLLDFDVASVVPAGATINSVTLTMWVNRNQSQTTMDVELHKVLADWGEAGSSGKGDGAPAQPGDATWLHTFYSTQFWANPGGDYTSTVSGVKSIGLANNSYTWSTTPQMVADVQSWLNNPNTAYGWLLKGNETSRSSHRFDSRESTNAAHRPTLTIDYSAALPPPTVAIAATDANKAEGNSGGAPFTFTVTRSGDTSGVTTVNFAVTGSGANPADAADFVGSAFPSGSITFNAGETSKVITIDVNGDKTIELNETFTITLTNAVGGSITTAAAAGTISNDDVAPSVAIAATDTNKAEGNSGGNPFTFTVTRSGDTSGVTTVNFAVTGSGANPADAADFVGSAFPSGSVTFNAGETSKVITINVNGDTAVEQNESFAVTLSNAVGGSITTAIATGTINNDDVAPSVAIAVTDANKAEGDFGGNPFTFTVTRSGDTSGVMTVDYVVIGSGDNPADAADFVGDSLPSGSITFNAGETSKVITIDVNGDKTIELNETFTITLTNAVGGSITTAAATGTINNDDIAPSVAIAVTDANKAEGDSGDNPFTFTVTRSGDTSFITTVSYAVTGSGANPADAEDFVGNLLPSGSITFDADETSKVISINVNGDKTVEQNEAFTVTLSNAVDGTITTAAASGTITNDDHNYTTVTASPSKDNTLILNDTGSVSNGAGDVFVGRNSTGLIIQRGLLDFDIAGIVPAGAIIQSVTLTMNVVQTQVGDRGVELHKVLADWGEAGSSGAGTGAPAQTGDATWLHTFYDTQFWTTPGGDFSPTASGVQTIGAQGTTVTWNSTAEMVADVQNWLDHPEANFGWLLLGDETQNSSKRLSSREATDPAQRPLISIEYYMPPPTDISISDVVVAEGNEGTSTAQFTVTLSTPSTRTVTVDYATADGTALVGSDYEAAGGTITFAPNETTKTITVNIQGDKNVELDENFFVNLSNPTFATIAKAQGLGTITNDDAATLSIDDASIEEGNTGTKVLTFTVTLSGTTDIPISVVFTTANGTAASDSDYAAASGTLTWNPGDSAAKTISVTINGDTSVETNETFLVNLTNSINGTLSKSQGVGTITNDDTATLSIDDVSIEEGNTGTKVLTFTVTLSGTADIPISVDFATANGTATSNSDYAAASGTLTWNPGDTSVKTISVTINGDASVEANETFFVNLTNSTNATLSKSQGVGTITNDDLYQTYSGTAGDDIIQVVAGAAPGSWTFKLNGTTLSVDPLAHGLVLDGLGGNDSLTIAGSSGDEKFEFWPDQLQFGGLSVAIANIESIAIDGGSGADSLVFHDSAGNDTFEAGAGWAKATAAGIAFAANNFENVQANSSSGNDTATLFDNTSGNSTFTAGPSGATFAGAGFNNTAVGFKNVQAYAALGKNGTAIFTGSDGNDLMIASYLGAQFISPGYEYDAWNFNTIQGSGGSGGADEARFYGSPKGNDTLMMTADGTTQTETGMSLKGTGFATVASYVYPIGNNTATIVGTAGVERAVTSPLGVQLFGTNLALSAWNYHHVNISGNGGDDTANMYPSAGADTFSGIANVATFTSAGIDRTINNFSKVTAHGNAASSASFFGKAGITSTFDATPTQASMSGAGYANVAVDFGSNTGIGVVGGTDIVNYEDSAGTDYFISSYLGTQMFGKGFNNSAWNFAEMNAKSTGGADVARFYGSSGDADSFVATPIDAQHTGKNFHSDAQNFARVEAYSGLGSGGTAQLTGSNGDDHYVASPLGAQLWGNGYRVEAWNYASVKSEGNGGNDLADLYGKTANNKLVADNVFAEFSGDAFDNRIDHFATTKIHGATAGLDTAELDHAYLESGIKDQPSNSQSLTITRKLWLYDFDQISTTEKPNNPTPQPQVVDKLMTAFMYE